MNEILRALADAIRQDPTWLILVLIVPAVMVASIAKHVAGALSGRSKLNATRTELTSLRTENTRLHELALRNTDHRALISGVQNQDVVALAEQARVAVDERAEALHLLVQVQATDRAWPQLPQELRDDIDTAIDRHRARNTSTTRTKTT